MSGRARCVAAFLLPALAALGACGGEPSGPRAAAGGPRVREVVDCAGVRVRLPAAIARVVTTAPGLTASVVAMGMGTTLVGVSDQDARAGALADLPRIAVYPMIPAEAVAALSPDLVLVDAGLSGKNVDALRARFPCTFVTDTSHTLDRLHESFLRIGDALGRPQRARALADELDAARRRHRVPGRPRVLVLGQVDPLPPYAIGPQGLLGDMVAAVGAENAAWDLSTPSGPIASEVVVDRAPDWILHTGGTLPAALRAAWRSVPAIVHGHVVDIGEDRFQQGGPATVDALARLAEILGAGGPR